MNARKACKLIHGGSCERQAGNGSSDDEVYWLSYCLVGKSGGHKVSGIWIMIDNSPSN